MGKKKGNVSTTGPRPVAWKYRGHVFTPKTLPL